MKTMFTALAIGAAALAFTSVPAQAADTPDNPVEALLQTSGDLISLVPDTAVEILTFGTAETHTYDLKNQPDVTLVAPTNRTIIYDSEGMPVHIFSTTPVISQDDPRVMERRTTTFYRNQE